MKLMNFSTWLNMDNREWPWAEELKATADLSDVNGSVSVGSIRIYYRGLVDITGAFTDAEIQRLTKMICDAYLKERAA